MKSKAKLKDLIFEQKVILGLSLPLIVLLIFCSSVGLLYPKIYASATPNWLTQTVVQDGVNLFLVTPVLIVGALYAFNGVKLAFLMWGGTVSYLVYTFLIYCFSVHFNSLFLVYCIILGLSVFSLGWFFTTQIRHPVVTKLESKPFLKTTGIYFITIAIAFYLLWLLEVVPASLSNKAPESLVEGGLMTNPIHVIDLSVFLPFVFIAGVLTLKGRNFAAILIPVLLLFFILMDITIAALTAVLIQNGFGGSWAVAFSVVGLAMFSLILLLWFVKNAKDELGD